MTNTLLIDANNLLMRSVFAVRGNKVDLSSSDGTPTAALHVFANMLSRHVREEQPTHIVVCWDGGQSNYRTTLYPEYKADRRAVPEEEQPDKPFSQAKEFLTLAGLHHVERSGWEADDLIACYWKMLQGTGKITILSSDKDLLQLLDEDCEQVRFSSKPQTDRWDHDRVVVEFGCTPEQIPLAMALAGDYGDGVPGLPRFGMKTAVKALAAKEWSLDAFTADRSEADRQMVNLCYRLVDLRDTQYVAQGLRLAVPPPFNPTKPTSMQWPDLLSYLDRYELASITRKILDGSMWSDQGQELPEID